MFLGRDLREKLGFKGDANEKRRAFETGKFGQRAIIETFALAESESIRINCLCGNNDRRALGQGLSAGNRAIGGGLEGAK